MAAGDELGRNREHRDVDVAWNVLDALVRLQPHDLVGGRVDRVDLPLVAAVDQVLHHRVADLAGLRRGADDGDRLRLHDAVHVAHDVFVLRAIPRRRRREIDDDADVGRDRAVLGGEDRVQVHLRDFRIVGDELRHVLDHLRERVAIDRIGAADALEDLRGGDAVEHRQRIVLGRGRETERDVLEHFDQDAAETEGDQLAEHRIGDRADDHFLAAGEHLLHLDAENVGLGVVLLRVGDDGVEALLGFLGAVHADQHASRLGLVENLRRDDLEHHRKAHPRGDRRGVGGRRRHAFLAERRSRTPRTRSCLPVR